VRRRAAGPLGALAGIVLLAAALRLWRIGHQSYWLDETFTAGIVRRDFGGMLHAVRHTESTPPLFYVLAWLWERLLGWHEAGLRSLSVLFGVATVPAAYMAARERFSERAALMAAALFAVNPYFVWYSQEARAYALLVLLCTVSLLFFLRAGRDGRDTWKWAVASALALCTHYFAALVVAPEAAWLVWRRRSRAALVATAAVAAVAGALLPLAIAQRNSGHTLFISEIPFGRRLVSLPKKLATGELGTPTPVLGPAIGAALTAGAVLALLTSRRTAGLLLGLAAATVAVALAMKLAGLDYFFPRNLIEAFVPALLAIGAGLAAVRFGPFIGAGLVLAGIALAIQVSVNPRLQRDDWRGAVRALGPAAAPRVLVVTPEVGRTPLGFYASRTAALTRAGARVTEIDVVANARPPHFTPRPAPPGFRLASIRRAASWEVVRYVSASPRPIGPNHARGLRLDLRSAAATLVQLAGG
jgi:mannosyltransferase